MFFQLISKNSFYLRNTVIKNQILELLMGRTEFPPMSDADLSRFWYCPRDNTRLQPKLERIAQNAFFRVSKDNLANSINNAVSLRKIPESAVQTTDLLAKYMFGNLPSDVVEIELVGTECQACQTRYASPKLQRVIELGKGTGRALYDSQKMLATKNYGRFRFVDRFGLGKNQNQEQNQNSGMRNLFFLGFFFGFTNLILVLVLYYIMGLEMKIGKKFYPIGPILLIMFLSGILYLIMYFNILAPFVYGLGRL